MSYDYQGAIKAGANPDDVLNYMASQTGYKATEAIKAGANRDDVFKYMANIVPKTKTPTPAIDTSNMPRSRFVNKNNQGVTEREFLDPATGRYNFTNDAKLKDRLNAIAEVTVDPIYKFLASAVRVPTDLVSLARDKEVSQYQATLPSGRISGTIQAGAKDVTESVMAGDTSPLAGTANLVGETVEGAGGVLGVADLAATGVNAGTNAFAKIAATTEKKGPSIINRAKDFISSKIGGKTSAQILQTPESEVGKLAVKEQKLWYQNKAQIAADEAKRATLAAKEASDLSVAETKQQINQFQQKLGSVTREKAIGLKKPAQNLMKESSETYIQLSGEAADSSPALSRKVNMDDLSSAIDSRFDEMPDVKVSLKKFLGIDDFANDFGIDLTKFPKAQSEILSSKNLTNQTILDKARELMSTVSKISKSGGRAYTSAEYEAIKQYQFLMEQLGKNGVDMTAANKFWREWVPVRDRIFREIKPFDETNVGKMPISQTIRTAEETATTGSKSVSKLDAQNFISELESRLKLPNGSIGAKTRRVVSQIEKAKLSKDVQEKAIRQITKEIQEARTEALKTMSLKQFDTERQAIINKITKRVLIGLGVYGAAKVTGLDKTVLNVASGVL